MKKENVSKQDKIVELVKILYNEAGITKAIKQLCSLAITKKDAILCYQLANILRRKDIMKDLQNVVLESKNPDICYLFARDVKGAEIKPLQQVVINSRDVKLCYFFARDVEHANVKELQKVVVDSKNATLCYLFARDVEGAEIEPLQQVVINSGDKELCKKFALSIEWKEWARSRELSNAEKVEEETNSMINE